MTKTYSIKLNSLETLQPQLPSVPCPLPQVKPGLYLHVQRLLSFGCLLLGAVADHSVAMGQVQVECNQWAVLHAQSAQGGSVDLQGGGGSKGHL